MPLIFVYGTLKRGGSNHGQLSGQQFQGTARTAPGFRLFHLGQYPGMVPYPADRDGVEGEIWLVDEAHLSRLDVFEGVPEGMYRRERVTLLPPYDGKDVETYVYARSVQGKPELGPVWRE